MIVPSYSLESGFEASYSISEDGNTTVSLRCTKPLKFRETYVGTATLEFYWSKSWVFVPTIIEPYRAQHTETTLADGQTQVINVALGRKIFAASGLVDVNVAGKIIAPAVHFDLPLAADVWVFLLRSPWYPLNIEVEKPSLSIKHNLSAAAAELSSTIPHEGGQQTLRADLAVHGDGFKWVKLSIKRNADRASDEEDLGSLNNGFQTMTWKPTIRSFNVLLVTRSQPRINQFVEFLKYLGAKVQEGAFFGSSLRENFVVCDGLNMNYKLILTGEKGLLGHEKDETAVLLKPDVAELR